MKLVQLYEDKKEPPESFKPGSSSHEAYRMTHPPRVPIVVKDAKFAAKAVANYLRQMTSDDSIPESAWKNIQRNIRIVKSNPKIADLLYRWLADYMRKVGHVFTDDEMENFRIILVYLKN